MTDPTTPMPGAAEALVRQHVALARSLAARYADRGEPLDDLVQVAHVGLVKAANRFDPSKGLQFSTFATATILGELKRYFRDHRWGVRVSRSLQELFLSTRAAIDDLTNALGRSPTVDELADRVGTSAERILQAIEVGRSYRLRSLDVTVAGDDTPTLTESLGAEDAGLAGLEVRAEVGGLLARLAPREREIVRLRFIEELTQMEIARRVGLSQMQVSRLLARSLDQLRHWAHEERASAGVG